MTDPETPADDARSPTEAHAASPAAKPRFRQRATALAAAGILFAVFATPIVGFLWLRGAVVHESEMNALWHTQTMLIRHIVRTKGEWPGSWDDLDEDFQPTNKSHRTDSIDTLKRNVDINFDLDRQAIDFEATNEPPVFLALKSRRLEAEAQKANRQLLEYLGKSRPTLR